MQYGLRCALVSLIARRQLAPASSAARKVPPADSTGNTTIVNAGGAGTSHIGAIFKVAR